MILPLAGIVGFLAALGGIVLWFSLALQRKPGKMPSATAAGTVSPHSLHESAILLENKATLRDMLDCLLESIVRLPGIDCGGVYVVRESDGSLDLVAHRGLSESFVAQGRRVESNSPRARSVMAGVILTRDFGDVMRTDDNADMILEGLRASLVVPVKYNDQVIAAINVGTHIESSIPAPVVKAIETTAVQLGGIIARMRAK
jgi:GAF domain-containing protein